MGVKSALVLSAGGMFGAYQVGAWKSLAGIFQPDIVVGASVGALNGWAIAGGCSAGNLKELWLSFGPALINSWRFPRSFLDGVADSEPFETRVLELYSAFRPQVEFGLTLTSLPGLKPELIRGTEVTWQHLAGSCGVPGIMRQQRIDGTLYSDGGLLGALPLWAAVAMGAEQIIGINVMPKMRPGALRMFLRGLRKLSRFHPAIPESIRVITVVPPEPLGSAREIILWNEQRIVRWIEQGERDVDALKNEVFALK